jgi:hypothetical protein
MASKVEIFNMALQSIGAGIITSPTENSTEAIHCNLRYNTARRSLLNMHPWNFAIKRVKLNSDIETPEFNYAFQYTLPNDFLFLVNTDIDELSQYNNESVPNQNKVTSTDNLLAFKYQIEGFKITTNQSDLKIIYVSDVDDTSMFSATFTNLLSYYLAAHVAYAIKGDKNDANEAMNLFETKLRDFKTLDSQQGTISFIKRSNWINSRF